MQSLYQMSLTRCARTSSLSSCCCQRNIARPAGMAIFIQAQRLANKAELRENDTERPPDADSNEDYSNSKELPQPSATDGAKEHDEYYSLKMHREGPNTEGGELDPKSESKDVKRHNKDMANRYEKR